MEYERLSDGSTVNVLSELELMGEEDIWTQLLKLSEDTLIVPEHVELEVLVVIVVVSIASENVTVMLSVIATELWLSAVVETEDTVGAVVSVVVEFVLSLVLVCSSFSPQEIMVRLKMDMRIICKILFIFFLTTKSKILIVGMLVD